MLYFCVSILIILYYKSIDYVRYIIKKDKIFLINNLRDKIYMSNLDIKTTLSLDNPSENIYKKRYDGHYNLIKKINKKDSIDTSRIADCRFKKYKILFPILKALEVDNPNIIIKNKGSRVLTNSNTHYLKLGADSISFFNSNFYDNIKDSAEKIYKESNIKTLPFIINPYIVKHTELIKELTSLDQVRYCTSGSEAVNGVFNDVRLNTGKKLIVRFKKAYHGWIDGVSFTGSNIITLEEMSQKSLDFIEENHYNIAGVIINPMQYFTGINILSRPGEKLTNGKTKDIRVTKEDYANWLYRLKSKCNYCSNYLTPIAFIIDDIYFGFRTKELFSYKYFNIKDDLTPDILILGKGVSGGTVPLSIIAGNDKFINSYDKNYLLKVNKTVGTWSAYTYGVISSYVFLKEHLNGNLNDKYQRVHNKFDNFTKELNMKLNNEFNNDSPISIKNFSNVFMINYRKNSLYNSKYIQYLMAQNIFVSVQTTGKFNLSDDYSSDDLELLGNIMVSACKQMKADGYFEEYNVKLFYLRLSIVLIKNFISISYKRIMTDKRIDIEVSHNHPFNKFSHFWSSVFQIFPGYYYLYTKQIKKAFVTFLLSHIWRQSGHFFYERTDRDLEKKKFGHKDMSKKYTVVFIICLLAFYTINRFNKFKNIIKLNDESILKFIMYFTIIPHFCEIVNKYGILRGLEWYIKIVTDPFTDLIDFYKYMIIPLKEFSDFKSIDEI